MYSSRGWVGRDGIEFCGTSQPTRITKLILQREQHAEKEKQVTSTVGGKMKLWSLGVMAGVGLAMALSVSSVWKLSIRLVVGILTYVSSLPPPLLLFHFLFSWLSLSLPYSFCSLSLSHLYPSPHEREAMEGRETRGIERNGREEQRKDKYLTLVLGWFVTKELWVCK
jgi:hypothetical protein